MNCFVDECLYIDGMHRDCLLNMCNISLLLLIFVVAVVISSQFAFVFVVLLSYEYV